MVKLGYNSNGFRSTRLLEAIPWLADLGYQAVAITPDVGCLDPANTESRELERVGALCRSLGLQVVVETGARYVLHPREKHRPNLLEVSEDWKQRLGFLQQMLQWCAALESQVLSFWSGVLPQGQTHQGAMSRMAQCTEVLSAQAEEHGVALGLEPEPGHWVQSLRDWSMVREKCGESMKLTLDTGHLHFGAEGPISELVSSYEEHIVNVHIDDMVRGAHHHLAIGEGEINWTPVAAALNGLGSTIPACLELSRDSHRFHELAPKSIHLLRTFGLHT